MLNEIKRIRIRNQFIELMLDELPSSRKAKNTPTELLKQGFIHDDLQSEWNSFYEAASKETVQTEPLSFTELSSYASWFSMHPDKVAGEIKVTTSLHFPLKVSATKEDVITMLDKAISNNNKLKIKKMKLKAKALKLKLALENEGLNGLSQAFSSGLIEFIHQNESAAIQVIEESQTTLNGLGDVMLVKAEQVPTLSFEEMQEKYNKGISDDEIKAWVWYKRSLGVPMFGWEKFFLDDPKNGFREEKIKTTTLAQIYDNHFRPMIKAESGTVLGKRLKKTHKYDGITYHFFRDQEGIKMIAEGDFEIIKSSMAVDERKLIALVKKGALYFHDGELLPYPIYAYANMYDRQRQLDKDRELIIDTYGEQSYDNHQKVINDVKPKVLSFQNPDPNERPKLMAFHNKVSEISFFRVAKLRDEYDIDFEDAVSLQNAFYYYLDYLDKTDISIFENVSFSEIWDYYILKNTIPRRYSDTQKELILKYAPIEGEKLFAKFLHEALTITDQQALDIIWNSIYNGWSSIPFHRVPIGFESSAKFKQFDFAFSPIQREGISFMEVAGSGCIAYDVGVGKTVTAIIALANAIQSGKCLRPAIIVPNQTYVKWIREIIGYENEKTGEYIPGVLTNTGISINDWSNLGTSIAPKLNLNAKVPAKSITMLTYEGFVKIGYSNDTMIKLFDELKEIMAQAIEDGNSSSQRDVEKEYQKYRELLGIGKKGTICDIETLGIDYLVIDEAHNFRNIFSYVPKDNAGKKRFDIHSNGSDRGVKAFFLTNYIQRTYGSNVMLLTATPFTNNPIEIYSMTSLIGHSDMVNMGVNNLYDFMQSFISQSLEYVNTADGEIRQKMVVKSFNNRLILQKLLYNKYHYKTGEEAGVKRPCKINIPRVTVHTENGGIKKLPKDEQLVSYLQMNEEQVRNQNDIIALAQSGKTRKERGRNTIRALSLSLDNALSPFLYSKETPADYAEFVDLSPKIKYAMECIKSVKEYHENTLKTPVSGQVIYINRGKEYFKYIKEYLEKEVGYRTGVKFDKLKLDEVEIITSDISKSKKENIKDAFLAGVCKVIIGTATIREGIDLQTYGTNLYNLYPDWNPTDVQQLEGRIYRQGNKFGYVRSVMPLVQDSMDVFVFQKLDEKTSRVNDLWFRADRGNVLDVEALDPEEVKFALYTNVDMLAEIQINRDANTLNRRMMALDEDIKLMTETKSSIIYLHDNRLSVLEMFRTALPILQDFRDEYNRSSHYWRGVSESQIAELEERSIELVKEIQLTLEKTPYDDKDIIRIFNRLKNSQYVTRLMIRLNNMVFERYKTYFSKIAKAEATYLKNKGYALSSDFNAIVNELKQSKAKLEGEMKRLQSVEYKHEVIENIINVKTQNKVDGRGALAASADFKRLNYLLKYKFSDTDINSCQLPKKADPDPTSDKTERGALQITAIPKSVRKIMPLNQQKAIVGSEEHWDVIDRLEKLVKSIPTNDEHGGDKWFKSHPNADWDDYKRVYLHYFYRGSDWWITDLDKDGMAHGYVVLNRDVDMSEYGSIYLPELLNHGKIELDFYWNDKKTLAEAKYQADPDYFKKPYKAEKNQDRPPVDAKLAFKRKMMKMKAKALKLKLQLEKS